jgi:hypothetical protein
MLMQDPKCTKSKTLMLLPSLANPYTLIAEPTRSTLRIDILEPRMKKSNIEKELPARTWP